MYVGRGQAVRVGYRHCLGWWIWGEVGVVRTAVSGAKEGGSVFSVVCLYSRV